MERIKIYAQVYWVRFKIKMLVLFGPKPTPEELEAMRTKWRWLKAQGKI